MLAFICHNFEWFFVSIFVFLFIYNEIYMHGEKKQTKYLVYFTGIQSSNKVWKKGETCRSAIIKDVYDY